MCTRRHGARCPVIVPVRRANHGLVSHLLRSKPLTPKISRCVLCASQSVTTCTEHERVVTVSCADCGGVVRVEFDPPDAPALRARIDLIVEPRTGRSQSIQPHDDSADTHR